MNAYQLQQYASAMMSTGYPLCPGFNSCPSQSIPNYFPLLRGEGYISSEYPSNLQPTSRFVNQVSAFGNNAAYQTDIPVAGTIQFLSSAPNLYGHPNCLPTSPLACVPQTGSHIGQQSIAATSTSGSYMGYPQQQCYTMASHQMPSSIAVAKIQALSAETVRKVVEEGRDARNLYVWNVPLGEKGSLEATKTSKKPPTSPRPQSASPKPPSQIGQLDSENQAQCTVSKRLPSLCRPKSRVRSASAGRNPEKDLRARYWAFLFENLHRAVDEIYQTCETDESIVECKEAIMMLENYSKEFRALIQWLNISKNYENTPPPNRPASLAWEVRKSSPGKTVLRNVFIDKLISRNSPAKRVLNFDKPSSTVLLSTSVQTEPENSAQQLLSDELTSKPSKILIEAENNNYTILSSDEKCLAPNNVLNSNLEVEVSDSNYVNNIPNAEISSGIEAVSTITVVPALGIINTVNSDDDNLKILCEAVKTDSSDFVVEDALTETVDIDSKETNKDEMSLSVSKTDSQTICNSSSVDDGENHNIDSESPEMSEKIKVKADNSRKKANVDIVKPLVNGVDKVHDVKNGCDKTLEAIKPIQVTTLSACTSSPLPISSTEKNGVNEKSNCVRTSVTNSNMISQRQTSITSATSPGQKIVKSQISSRNITTDSKRYNQHSAAPLPQRRPLKANSSESNLKRVAPTGAVSSRGTFMKHSVTSTSIPSSQRYQVPSSQLQANKSLSKDQQKNGSSSSLSSTSSGKSWADKVKGSTTELHVKINSEVTEKMIADDDSEGWEMVRGRTRCRNSPAKKLPSSNCRTNQVTAVVQSKQVKMGSFPYSCTPGSQAVQKKNAQNTSVAKSSPGKLILEKSHTEQKVKKRDINSFPNAKSNSVMNKSQMSTKKKEQLEKKLEAEKKTTASKNITLVSSRNSVPLKSTSSKEAKVLVTDDLLSKNTSKISQNGKAGKMCGKLSEVTQVRRHLSADDIKITSKDRKFIQDKYLKKSVENLISEIKGCGTHQSFGTKRQTLKHIKTSSKELSNITDEKKTYVSNNRNFASGKGENIVKSVSEPKIGNEIYEEEEEKILNRLKSLSDPVMKGKTKKKSSHISNKNFQKQSIADIKENVKEKKSKTFENDNFDKSNNCLDLYEDNQYLYESDTGLTSDDQDGIASHDEGCFDPSNLEWYDKIMREEAQERVHQLGLSWGDQMDHLDMELRTPGRALQMHEKLSSPFRKRSLSETIRRHEEKQLKAQEQRERLLEEKAQRFKDIAKKVEEMKAWKEERQQRQRIVMEQKLQRAEEKRRRQLQMIVRKAHDEEEKVNEIAFINTLEAQNKRHDLISKEKDHEARLQDIQGERQRRLEEKAAKEAAAEERRKALEAERQARLLEMQEKRKLRDLKIEQQLMEKEKERQELANQKARDRELRLSALNAAQQATLEELQKKIQQKQEESARRHEENMEQIRLKAFELSVRRYSSNNDDAPRLVPYETKKICTLCNVLIGSEVYLLSHLRGKKHQETVKDQHQGQDPSTEELESYNLKHIVDAPADQLDPNIALDKERQKALKKRCKKLRQRMTNRGLEYETALGKKSEFLDSQFKYKMGRIIKDVKKYMNSQGKGPWDSNLVNSLERSLGELERLFDKSNSQDKVAFRIAGGIGTLLEILNVIADASVDNATVIPSKSIIRASLVASLASENCYDNCHYILFSNRIGAVLDLLIHRLSILIPDNFCQLLNNSPGYVAVALPVDQVAGGLMHFLGTMLTCLSTREPGFTGIQHMVIEQSNPNGQGEEFQQRVHDVVSYIVSIGIVDKLSQYFNNVRGPIDAEPDVAAFLLNCMSFLTALAKLFSDSYDSVFDRKKTEDTTQLVATFKVTEMAGTVSLLYGMLLHSGAPSRGNTPPPKLLEHTLFVTLAALRMLNHMAVMDLQVVQGMLGSEGLSLQLRHIASYLLWYCMHWTSDDLLQEVILLIGYFTVLNPDNQTIIQSGQRPTVLQQMCSLPFQYFSDPKLTNILFPTLIACCYSSAYNKAILEQEMSPELLSNYIEAHLLDLHQAALFPSKNKKGNDTSQEGRLVLASRFPKDRWTAAKQYFSVEG